MKAKKAAKKTGKEKTFKIRKCPKCESDNVGVVIGKTDGSWECHKCKYNGKDFKEVELSEDEFMKYLDDKGEEVL